MITLKATMTCNYTLSKKQEYKILEYADEKGLNLEKAIEELQKNGAIDLLYNEPYEETITSINEAAFEKDERV